MKQIAFRGDAAFAQPNMYEYLEAEGIDYAIRLPANQALQERVSDLPKRPVGRPAHYVQRFYRSFRYRAASWKTTTAYPRLDCEDFAFKPFRRISGAKAHDRWLIANTERGWV